MVVCFGFSWPMNVIKSYRARTTKGKSLPFLLLIITGYVFGIIGKLIGGNFKWYVLFFYVLNLAMVSVDLALYVRNYRLDKQAIIHCPIGKKSFTAEQLVENLSTLIGATNRAKPAAAKGVYLRSVVLSSTMGPGIKVNPLKF